MEVVVVGCRIFSILGSCFGSGLADHSGAGSVGLAFASHLYPHTVHSDINSHAINIIYPDVILQDICYASHILSVERVLWQILGKMERIDFKAQVLEKL